MKDFKYYVIGGQYFCFCYGGANTLIGAKRIAHKNVEYWDNWQGFHTPVIYAAEDTTVVQVNGSLAYYDGQLIRIPKAGTVPVWKEDLL